MEWTGARYADGPTVEAATTIDARPARVWSLISDITLMPQFSTELQRIEWLDGATAPAVGARFRGHNKHAALGEWSTESTVIECVPESVLAWAVGDPEKPSATWRFTLRADGGETRLREWARMGPGASGLSMAIDAMPDKEQKIVFVRLREFEQGMLHTLAEIKQRAEQA